ncbi:MAG: hypothetical protein M1829_004010 [Trizodia sp. TS-e1964]|nr:MAG: hypothetical protein M1829_004010 [Trizodia sp. TS-e1964]
MKALVVLGLALTAACLPPVAPRSLLSQCNLFNWDCPRVEIYIHFTKDCSDMPHGLVNHGASILLLMGGEGKCVNSVRIAGTRTVAINMIKDITPERKCMLHIHGDEKCKDTAQVVPLISKEEMGCAATLDPETGKPRFVAALALKCES